MSAYVRVKPEPFVLELPKELTDDEIQDVLESLDTPPGYTFGSAGWDNIDPRAGQRFHGPTVKIGE